jgi:glycosyltransferase involved in cell wall biosynthesis
VAAITRAVTTLATDRDRLATMGQAARRRYERQHDWTETTERVRELLARVAEGGRQEAMPS